MITEAVLNFLFALAETVLGFVLGLIPEAPDFWVDAAGWIVSVYGSIPSPVLDFVPVVPVLAMAAVVTGIYLVLGGLVLGRRVLSLVTGGGGSIE